MELPADNGYIRYLRTRKAGAALVIHEPSPSYGLSEDELDALFNDSTVFNDSTI